MNNLLGGGGDYPVATQEYGAKMARIPTLKERLTMAVTEAESRLAEAKRAKEIFDKHPELEELIDIMQRGRF